MFKIFEVGEKGKKILEENVTQILIVGYLPMVWLWLIDETETLADK